MAEAAKYLDYLDKEMTIMGILSTFCIAVVAIVLDRICGAEPTKGTLFFTLWLHERSYVLFGSISFALGATFFYMQRSALAWFYGQITLSLEMPSVNNIATSDWYKDADSWATWVPYQGAFTAVGIGAALYTIALLGASAAWQVPDWLTWTATAATIVIQVIRTAIFRRYKYDDDPIGRVFPLLKRG